MNRVGLKIAVTIAIAVAATAAAFAESGIVVSRGLGNSKSEACAQAEEGVRGKATLDAARFGKLQVRITEMGDCDCEGPGEGDHESKWRCSVRATYETVD